MAQMDIRTSFQLALLALLEWFAVRASDSNPMTLLHQETRAPIACSYKKSRAFVHENSSLKNKTSLRFLSFQM